MHESTSGDQPVKDDGTQTVNPIVHDGETLPLDPDATMAAPFVPFSLGRYRITERLGMGGFGTVYRAFDEALAREVAVKVPHRHRISTPDAQAAYPSEGRALARLDHAGIVPVYDAGRTDEGLCYLVSKFIEGRDLKSQLRRVRPTRAEAVSLIISIAEALHYAHQRGIIHRDIKPANILLDTEGRPYIGDFGLALCEEDFGTGPSFTGTPAYMSPEQARGEGHRVDERTDIYSLGVVFYELLAGRLPYEAKRRVEMLEQIRAGAVRPLRELDATIPRELERICLKALSRRASDRYATALQLAEDLRHWEDFLLRRVPLAARPATTDNAPGAEAKVAALPTCETTAEPETRVGPIIPKGLRSFDATDAYFFLDLLPGPRGREGLPESVRFWKTRIESSAPDESFPVGLLYGPSGCGKSSLVKAGLLPRLAAHVTSVYVEATPDDLETRILKALRQRCPQMPTTLGLVETLTRLRREQGPASGLKILLVLDQFEQWLHAHRQAPPGELIEALRQCDGRHVQCLLLVRDDFWLAVSRFMRELEVPLVEGHNTTLVDLFDPLHARQVLAEFGRAFGRLPGRPGERSAEQERFLDQAVAGLAQDGKIIPVRLSLFADMTRGKPWTPATLQAVGGTEGIGVLFLEEALGPRAPHPEHRLHERACRAVLQALLPEQGTDIKGAMRSRDELLKAAGYTDRPKDFHAVLRILDTELRLITPADAGDDAVASYQLTHDFLVPALREWLTRRQCASRRGRAELCLRERAALWIARPQARHLPSGFEWARIVLFTRSREWSASHQKMMRAATRRYTLRLGALAVAVALLSWGAWEGLGYQKATTLVRVLEAANTTEAPEVIEKLAPYRRWADPMLRQMAREAVPASRERLNAGLALLPRDRDQAEFLAERLLLATPQETIIIREALRPHAPSLAEVYWQILASASRPANHRFNSALALAGLEPPSSTTATAWRSNAGFIVNHLLSEVRANPSTYLVLAEALRPARLALLDALAAVFRDRQRPDYERTLATTLLGDYAADQPQVLVELIKEADAEQYAILMPKLQHFSPEAVASMTAELARELQAGMNDADKDVIAKRQANAAVTLLRLERPERVWPLFKHGEDPRVRSFLIHRLQPLGVDPLLLMDRLAKEADVSAQRALLLSLGEYLPDKVPPETRESLQAQLFRWYGEHADPGFHSAVEWLLRRWGPAPPMKAAVQALMSQGPPGERNWYINRQGQTFAVLRDPPPFKMGSPPGEAGRDVSEVIVEKYIGRSFAIATTPVTLGQFQRFMKARKVNIAYTRKYCPETECPVIGVNWFTAAQYCRWLSEQEEIAPEEMCFPPFKDIKEGMKLPLDHLSRGGYRLATEAEWEYACRAGALTSRYYGTSEELLGNYGWYMGNSQVRTHPVGMLKPNDFGLFDMHGNIWQWCQERGIAGRPWGGKKPSREDREDNEPVVELHGRVLRGGGFYDHASFLRCSARTNNRPYQVDDYFGMRLARTIK